MIVGNLLVDPTAQSFISVEDANSYLNIERNPKWIDATVEKKQAALVCASRWLVTAFRWKPELLPAELVRVGQIAARIAGDTMDLVIFAPEDTSKPAVVSEKFGEVAFTYAQNAPSADAAGLRWPWLAMALYGLTYFSKRQGIGVLAV